MRDWLNPIDLSNREGIRLAAHGTARSRAAGFFSGPCLVFAGSHAVCDGSLFAPCRRLCLVAIERGSRASSRVHSAHQSVPGGRADALLRRHFPVTTDRTESPGWAI